MIINSSPLTQIYFIDYGNTESVEFSHIANIPPSLLSAPAFAVQSTLSGVEPAAGAEWGRAASDAFSDMVMISIASVEVVKKLPNSSYLVKLTVQGKSPADQLIAGTLLSSLLYNYQILVSSIQQ